MLKATDFMQAYLQIPLESLKNHFTTAHKEREQSGDRRNDGESNCNSGVGTGQMAQPWMFMMMMMMMMMMIFTNYYIQTPL
jgi:hypothetical protein